MCKRCSRLFSTEPSFLHRFLAAMTIATVLFSCSNVAGQLTENDVHTPNPFNIVSKQTEMVAHAVKYKKNDGRRDGLDPSERETLLDSSRSPGAFDASKRKRSITYASEQASRRTKKSAGPCDRGWTLKGNYCYKLTSQWQTWSKAEEECRSMRSLLAEIANPREQLDLHDFLKSRGPIFAWIGLSRQQSDKSWIWSSGLPFIYSNWMTDEPYNMRGTEDCVNVWHGRNSTWNAFDCTDYMPGICQKGYCDEGWTPTRRSCYRLTPEAPINVTRDTCRSKNGFLVEIQNVNEQNELRDYLTPLGYNYTDYGYPWIGLSDPLHNRSWRWDSGSILKYSSWIAGEPNNAADLEYCVTVWPSHNFSWNDAPCTLNSPGVCKQRKAPGGPPVYAPSATPPDSYSARSTTPRSEMTTTTAPALGCDAESSLCRTLSERGFCTQGIHRHYMAMACRRSCARCP